MDKDKLRRDAEQLGHKRLPLLKAIRHRCLVCQQGYPMQKTGQVTRDVEECFTFECPLWPYRFGFNPWTKRTGRDAAQMALARNASKRGMRQDGQIVSDGSQVPSEQLGVLDGSESLTDIDTVLGLERE